MIEWTVCFTAILPLFYGACNIRVLLPSIKHVYPCSMHLSFVSWWQWSIVLFYFYAEGGELSRRWLCRHRWHRGCRFHNLRCRRWRQGRCRGGSLVSVSVFIVYYMYIYLISRRLALITNKSYCFLFLVSTLNKDFLFLSYLILYLQSRWKYFQVNPESLEHILNRIAIITWKWYQISLESFQNVLS